MSATSCFLIGLPGSGKSTVGRQLARRIDLPFFDSDHVIEQRLGCSIREFFEREGEDRFRDIEAAILDAAEALLDVLDHLVSAIPGARVGAIGHGDKLGFQHLQSFDGLPEGILHPFTVGGKKLEADRNVVTQVSQTLVECLNLTCTVKSHLLSPCPATHSSTSKRMFGRLNVFLSL